ncbi:hypothetical protein SGGMMB4_00349 [Sodalis glossinidius str. 'morsitans']|uniref:Uncharacterized protein n=1 Tax=Sodalis glossinidius (strain morsitans) TaxID=343509 RepID=A0A193QF34_SODGM|nr:hypothetical protein SGGMMB4_00349 [Sodalis glossinidius str. 'morsitans']
MGIAPHAVEPLLEQSTPGIRAISNRSLYLPAKLDTQYRGRVLISDGQ